MESVRVWWTPYCSERLWSCQRVRGDRWGETARVWWFSLNYALGKAERWWLERQRESVFLQGFSWRKTSLSKRIFSRIYMYLTCFQKGWKRLTCNFVIDLCAFNWDGDVFWLLDCELYRRTWTNWSVAYQIHLGLRLNKMKKTRRCRGSNPGRPRDRREYSPLYYNDLVA